MSKLVSVDSGMDIMMNRPFDIVYWGECSVETVERA